MIYKFSLIALVALTVLVAGQTQAQDFVTDGLVSFWSLDSSSMNGNIARDLWGNNDGEMIDTKTVEGKINEGLEFNGSSSLISVPHDSSLNLADAITLEAWIKLRVWDVADRHSIMTKYGSDDKRYIQFIVRPNSSLQLFLGHTDGTDFLQATMGGESPEWVGIWLHVAATWDKSDGGLAKLYINGQELASYANRTDWEDSLTTNDLPLSIGAMPGLDRFLDGIIDEVRIYDRRLSDEEIMTNFSAELNVFAVIQPSGKLATTWADVKLHW